MPALQDRLGLDNGEVGLALLATTGGLIVAQPLAGALAARRGSAPVVSVVAVAVAVVVVAPSLAMLAVAMAAVGAATGSLDVSMNVQGVAVERDRGGRILSRLQAAFSAGVFGGRPPREAPPRASTSPRWRCSRWR